MNSQIIEKKIENEVKQTIIIIGTTGTGKSTVLNMIYNEGYLKNDCLTPAITGNFTSSVTKMTQMYFNLKQSTMIIDTVGLADPELRNFEIELKLKQFLRDAKLGINCIIVTVKYGRIDEGERINFDLINQIFESNWKSQSVLVVTHYDGELEDPDAIKSKWISKEPNDSKLSTFINSFPKIIFTNNMTSGMYEEFTRPLRKKCIEDLKLFFSKCEGKIRVSPKNILEILKYFFERYFSFFKKLKLQIKMVAQIAKEKSFSSVCVGNCLICREVIYIEEMIKTKCDHIFHKKCWKSKANPRNVCLGCGKIVDEIFSG